MKFTLTKKSNNTKHQLALPKHSFIHRIGRDFTNDWLVMLIVAMFLVVIFIGVGYIKYTSSVEAISSETDVVAPSKVISFDDKKLDELLSKFVDRQKTRDAINGGASTIPDPTL